MSRKRLTAWVLVLAVGMTVRAGIAAPKASIAELRAMACCAAHCPDTPRPPMRPHRCCVVESGATDPASTAVAPSLERPALAPVAILTRSLAAGAHANGSAPWRLETRRAGPPLPLVTQKLRC